MLFDLDDQEVNYPPIVVEEKKNNESLIIIIEAKGHKEKIQ